MYNFSEFCKEKKCEHYREWSIQAGKEGMVRCCDLVGMSFYVTTYPGDCVHLAEIQAREKLEKEKHNTWQKISTVRKTPGERLQEWIKRSSGIQKKYTKDDIL